IVQLPGFIDVHVHFRVPGAGYKEDFASGTAAALAGGVTQVLVMPNTKPSITNFETIEIEEGIAKTQARCDYALFLGATETNSKEAAEIGEKGLAIGLKMYLNDTYGELKMTRMRAWEKHFEEWPRHLPICCHAEGPMTTAVIHLAEKYKRH